jgi:hypothetical protein
VALINSKLLLLVLFVGVALAVFAFNARSREAGAISSHGQPTFHLGIDVDGNGTDDCTASLSAPGSCTLTDQKPSAVSIYLDDAGLVGSGATGYDGYRVLLQFVGPVSFTNFVVHTWPDCGAPSGPLAFPGFATFSCFVSPWNHSSTYTGKIAEAVVTCSYNPGVPFSLGIVNGDGKTEVILNDGTTHNQGESTTIAFDGTCVAPTPPATSPCQQILGDVDGNRVVDAIDAMFLSQYVDQLRGNLACLANVDTDQNHRPSPDEPDSTDGLLILQYVAGLISRLPPQ